MSALYYLRQLQNVVHLHAIGQDALAFAVLDSLDPVDLDFAIETPPYESIDLGAEPQADIPPAERLRRSGTDPTVSEAASQLSSPSAPVALLDSYSRRVPCQ